MRYNNVFGEEISRLGFGGMRFPCTPDGKIDYPQAEAMIDRAMEAGVNYYDTAYGYHGGESEKFYGHALSKYPRDAYKVATKMPEWCCKEPADVRRIFEEQCSRVRVDFFDFYLVHNIQDGNWQHILDMKIIPTLLALKEEGRIGHLGFSFHGSAACLERVLSEWGSAFEFVQLQLNYFDWEYIEAGKLYDIARAHGKVIIVMEPVRGGLLASLSPDADAVYHRHAPDMSVASFAIRYVMDLPGVVITLSGMSNAEQVEDNLKNASCPPMTEADHAAIREALTIFRENSLIPCTACRYCMPCTVGIDIPRLFRAENDARLWHPKAEEFAKRYAEITGGNDCISCGKCVTACPQHIDIPTRMYEILQRTNN